MRIYRIIILQIIMLAFLSINATEYSMAQNYIMTLEAKYASTSAPVCNTSSSLINIDYIDGLGRRMQSIQVGGGGGGEDLCDLQEYGPTGKPTKKWLTIAKNSDGLYANKADFKNLSSSFYGADEIAYIKTAYEENILQRPIEEQGAGKDISGKPRKTDYRLNNNDKYPCSYFFVDIDNVTLSRKGNYSPGSLQVSVQTDENSNITFIFTDSEKRTVLVRRVADNNQWNDTYWVYDMYGDLRYMISPKAVPLLGSEGPCNKDIIRKLCYYYEYDAQSRMIMKQLPGVEPIYYVYDKLNRVIFSQDGNQRARGEWSVNKYDRKQRIAVEGVAVIAGSSRLQLQQQWGDSLLIEKAEPEKNYDAFLFYSRTSGPRNFTAHKAYFYDDYSHWNDIDYPKNCILPTDPDFPESANTISAKGLLTGTALLNFSSKNVVSTVIKYNGHGVPVLQCERDYSRTYSITTFIDVNFRGAPLRKKTITAFLAENTTLKSFTEQWKYSYDHAERLVKTEHKYQNYDWMKLSENRYDALGRVAGSSFGNRSNFASSYNYNIRGWLTQQVSPHFSQTLYYTSNPYNPSVKYYNGNISASTTSSTYQNAQNAIAQRSMHLTYAYDKLDRLTYMHDTNCRADWDVYDEMYTYDANGNPTSITRGYGTTPMQDITFGYSGNQIISIGNAGYDELLGKVPQIPTGEYISACSYDANGNMTRDDSREIASITYNPINLPALTRFADIKNSTGKVTETNAIYTDYRADGFKTSRLNRTIYITTATKVNSKGETIVYDKSTGVDNQRYYYGNLMKENGKVKHIYNEAGYVDVHEDDGTYCYNFYVRDYLGSTRAVVNQWGDLAQTTDYYPSGVPTTEYKSYWFDDRLHTGKEFNAFNGLFWYDNAARMLDPIFNRFTSPDPLAEKYPNLSPYAHCANNPLKYIDPTGMEWIWDTTIKEKDREDFEKVLQSSAMFRELYATMQNSKTVYTIKMGTTVTDGNGNNVPGEFNSETNTITLSDKVQGLGNYQTLVEEMVHGYQQENIDEYSGTNINREYEAKVATAAILTGTDATSMPTYGTHDWRSDFEIGKYGDGKHPISPYSLSFKNDYVKHGKSFVEFYKKNNLGNSHYRVPVTGVSKTFNKLIYNAFKR